MRRGLIVCELLNSIAYMYTIVHMKGKVEEKKRAITLRKLGYSINEIVRNVGVAKGTASLWLRDIELSEKARERLISRSRLGPVIAAEKKRQNRKLLLQQYNKKSIEELSNYLVGVSDMRVLCALVYWCEGAKDSSNGIAFTNSDPKIVKTFLHFFRKGFEINERKFRVCVHLHEYHVKKKQLEFWCKVTQIPLSQFIKPYLKQNTGKTGPRRVSWLCINTISR